MIVDLPASDPEQTALGGRLRRWRTHRGMEIEELGRQIGLSPAELRLVEAGRLRLDSAHIEAATRVLHLPLWALNSDTPAY